ncbi:MAG: hypothetical protein ABFC77_16165 [Thermoguttaceae bacterium]
MNDVFFTSMLPSIHRDALERLFYFNKNQKKVHDAVLMATERYGAPRVALRNGRLWVQCASGVETQSLFVMDGDGPAAELIGVIVYTREEEKLVVLFMAVREDYTYRSDRRSPILLLRMVEEVRNIGRRVKGITSVELFLRGSAASHISVESPNKL